MSPRYEPPSIGTRLLRQSRAYVESGREPAGGSAKPNPFDVTGFTPVTAFQGYGPSLNGDLNA